MLKIAPIIICGIKMGKFIFDLGVFFCSNIFRNHFFILILRKGYLIFLNNDNYFIGNHIKILQDE